MLGPELRNDLAPAHRYWPHLPRAAPHSAGSVQDEGQALQRYVTNKQFQALGMQGSGVSRAWQTLASLIFY